jgi:hypothetical protein
MNPSDDTHLMTAGAMIAPFVNTCPAAEYNHTPKE